MSAIEAFQADWPAPARVRTLITTRAGGVSAAPYASLNLGDHVGDDPLCVAANRARLAERLPAPPLWLKQTHGTTVADADLDHESAPDADGVVARRAGRVCAIMTADCLPLLLCDRSGSIVAGAHAGWRGLCEGVIEATVAAMERPTGEIMVWLGPAIGPDAFEVGAEVRAAFVERDPACAVAFTAIGADKYLADIYRLARLRLAALGIEAVWGGDSCTVIERNRFFSYRRDGRTGRMASLIWLAD
ncbi:peptidoglycan editing factor PgeF [Paludibacterium yongneupense]|uniref:peptidoglycan editing factor PgeF n=1 Tax=Paludibacterium yongneupense TaxID=400061 RepID=UPI0004148AD8|nr:peptidoglycan editing factor PgeF [Paludibacterium yongneupense]